VHTWHRRATLPLSHLHFWVVKRRRFTRCVCVGLSCEREWAPPPTVRLLCWQARALSIFPILVRFRSFPSPPPSNLFWLFVLYVQSHLTLRGIFFILLEFPGLLYYSTLHSHFLLIESTQTASFSVHNSRVHSRTNTTYPSLRTAFYDLSVLQQLLSSICVTPSPTSPLRLLLCWSRKSWLVDMMSERETCMWLPTRLSLLSRLLSTTSAPLCRLAAPGL